MPSGRTRPGSARRPRAATRRVLEKVVPLAEKATFIGDGADVAPGISAMAAFGHSPGHMVFRLESDGKAMMLTADTANHYVLSLQRPDWEVRFDMDKAAGCRLAPQGLRHDCERKTALHRLPHAIPGRRFRREVHDQGYRFVPRDLSVRYLICGSGKNCASNNYGRPGDISPGFCYFHPVISVLRALANFQDNSCKSRRCGDSQPGPRAIFVY